MPSPSRSKNRRGGVTALPPPFAVFEPADARFAGGKPGQCARVYRPALLGAPTDKTGAPLHAARKTVPRPIGRAADITNLRIRDAQDGLCNGRGCARGIAHAVEYIFFLRRVLAIDLRNHIVYGLAAVRTRFAGKENAERGAGKQADHADDEDNQHGDPTARRNRGHKPFAAACAA
jgi:hypothetical protein